MVNGAKEGLTSDVNMAPKNATQVAPKVGIRSAPSVRRSDWTPMTILSTGVGKRIFDANIRAANRADRATLR